MGLIGFDWEHYGIHGAFFFFFSFLLCDIIFSFSLFFFMLSPWKFGRIRNGRALMTAMKYQMGVFLGGGGEKGKGMGL